MSCYNADKTLVRAITSVLNNTYKNLELIIIDDASTDNSSDIALKYQQQDNRIILLHHPENLGAGVSRKDGIESSKGDYICFCDSDDALQPKHIQNLVEASIENDADIVTSGYMAINGDTGEFMENRKVDKVEILEGNNKYAVLKADVLRFLNPSLIRKELWSKVTYSTRRYIEDSPTLIKLLWYANKRVVLPESTYLYYQNSGSLTHEKDPFKDILYQTLCTIETYNFFVHEVNHPEYIPEVAILNKILYFLSSQPTYDNKQTYKNEIQEVKRFINKYYEEKFEQPL